MAQIARTVARTLELNEDLTEAIALAHDLGHAPFGHTGQYELNECMREFGGFEHNLQSLRVVDSLEQRYAAFHGLNLTFETREGILKRCSRARARKLGALGARFVEGGQPSLEAQVANIADEIAYNNHDVDDGLRSGLLTVRAMQAVSGFREAHAEVVGEWPDLSRRRVVHEVVRRMINRQVLALVAASRGAIESVAPGDIESVRATTRPLIRFTGDARARHLELKRFLHRCLYRHPHVQRTAVEASRIVRELFHGYLRDARRLPEDVRARAEAAGEAGSEARRARAVADYVAGMTDRFAIAEHLRLFADRGRGSNSILSRPP